MTNIAKLRLGGVSQGNWQRGEGTITDPIGSKLEKLPPEIGQLTNLKELDLSYNKLSSLPPSIGQFTGLTELDLSYNKLSSLPPSIGQFTGLTELDLGSNQLTNLPPSIGQLTHLTELDLQWNQLTSLPSSIDQLINLTSLNLRYNQLSSLPPSISQLSNLERLDLRGNPLPIPHEILWQKNKPAEIISYYLQHHAPAARTRPLNEAKMLLVGEGGVGKTSLVRRLVEGKYDAQEGKTGGIDIRGWSVPVGEEEVRLNVWDFGGQEFMHATHQFFLTKRSLYLVVLNARLGEEQSRLHYWLNLVQSFGGDAPIIVVVNQIDQQPLHLNRRELYQKYQSIKAFVHTSCKTGDGLDELRAAIIKEVGQLEHIHDKLLLSWFAVKEQLEGMKEDYIEYRAYEQLCEAEEIDTQSQETLIHLLHHLGVVLNFRDDPRLSETNVLNPRWVTEAFYAILNHRSLFESKGVLKQKDLPQILDPTRYPRPKHNFILDMMGKFELSFPLSGQGLALNGEHQYLIPDLLPKEEPDLNWSDADSLAFQYDYNFLPGSIISRFMVRMNGYIKKQTYWRSGVVLTYQGNEALVKADKEAKKILISVIGNDYTRREFLAIIRAEFDRIHQTIEKLSANEMVPLPKHNSIVIERSYLLELLEMGEESFIPPGLKKRISVRRLLEGVEPLSKQQLEQERQREEEERRRKEQERRQRELEERQKELERQQQEEERRRKAQEEQRQEERRQRQEEERRREVLAEQQRKELANLTATRYSNGA